MQDYQSFIESKKIKPVICGFDIEESELNPNLKPFQRAIVKWGLKRGRAAFFQDTGLGKTIQQLSWAHEVSKHTGGDVLMKMAAVNLEMRLEGAGWGAVYEAMIKAYKA